MSQIAYWSPPEENPNFVSRPPDPGSLSYYGTVAWDAIYHSPFSGAYRFSELTLAKTGILGGVSWNMEEGLTRDQNEGDRQALLLTSQEATQKYGLGGQLKFDEPIREDVAQITYRRKIAENDRNYVLQSGAISGFRQAAGLGVGMAATLVDPINVAMMFVPVVGEARMAQMAAKYGVTRARLATGSIEGTVGAMLAEPFVLLPALQEQANYGLEDSALNLGFGAVLGAGLHAGFGAIGDKIKSLKPKESNAIFESAINDVLQDRPVSAPAKVYEFTSTFEKSQKRIGEYFSDETLVHYTKKDPFVVSAGFKGNEPEKIYVSSLSETGVSNAYKESFGPNAVKVQAAPESISIDYNDLMLSRWEQVMVNDPPPGFTSADIKELAENPVGLGDTFARIPDEYFINKIEQDQTLKHELPLIIKTQAAKLSPVIPTTLGKTLNDIPLRDEKGRFIKKERRLQMLQQRINEEKVRGEVSQDNIVNDNTQPIQPRDNLDIPPRQGNDSEVSVIDQQIADLETEMTRNSEIGDSVKSRIEELTHDIGDTNARAKGVEAATDCIIRNLI
jgi:hypothetical protein